MKYYTVKQTNILKHPYQAIFKIKTTLLNYPDIAIVRENKSKLMDRRLEKLKFISNNEYLFCSDCLSSNFDYGETSCCDVCGSTSVVLMNKKVYY